ncbi:MAG TPA: class I SAM-dependent methyltransferase [Solirubrobacteraceae bacterium]
MEEFVYQQLYELEDTHWWFRGRRAVIWALLRRAGVPSGARVLDAGCGTGRNLAEFGRLGRAQGVDPSPQAIDFCRRRGLSEVREASLEALPFAAGTFDVILLTDVLEHVGDDAAALAELRRVAAPGARLVITVPAYRWLWSAHDDSHHHLRRYTAPRLRARVRGAGWRPLVETYFNSLLLAPIAAVRLVSRSDSSDYERTGPQLNRALTVPMRAEAAAIERGARLPAGVSVGMVAEPGAQGGGTGGASSRTR